MDIKKALAELRIEENKRKFDQSIDLIVNLKNIDLKRDQINITLNTPNKIKEKKVCAFLNAKSKTIDTITPAEFPKYKDKKMLKNLVKEYDFFISVAPLMPQVATNFGKVLGPAGKMPSPQLGLVMQENNESIQKQLDLISKSVKVRAKEASLKLTIGKESMKDEEVIENFNSVYSTIVNALPRNKDNIRSVLVKLTMSKPVKIE